MHVTETILTAAGTLAVSKAADYLISLNRNKTDRTTARESQADGATKTALDALKAALDAQEKALKQLREDHDRETGTLRTDVDAEKGKRIEAEMNVEVLKLSVDTLSKRIEEQDRELAAQPNFKAENVKLRRQVSDLQKQVGELKKRIADLEASREERVGLETEILLAQSSGIPRTENYPH